MNMVFRTLIVLVALAGLTETASAAGGIQFFYSNGSYGYGNASHNSHHQSLQRRSYGRQAIHHNAHHYPMSRYQHGALHTSLNHDAYHDRLEHRGAHRSGAYYNPYTSGYYYNPYGSRLGIGYSTPGFSFRISR